MRATLTDPDFDVPTTLAIAKGALFTVNARFTTPPTPETAYAVVRGGREVASRPARAVPESARAVSSVGRAGDF